MKSRNIDSPGQTRDQLTAHITEQLPLISIEALKALTVVVRSLAEDDK